jgi:nitrite reductase (NO-forming)
VLAVEVWSSSFAAHVRDYPNTVLRSQPDWLMPWFGTWAAVIVPAPGFFIWLARILTTLIAVFLLIGFARKSTYILGAISCLPLWTLMVGHASPRAFGTMNLSGAIAYFIFFISLMLMERLTGTTPYSVDYYLENRWPGWQRFSECARVSEPRRQVELLSWVEQVPIILIVLGALMFLISGSIGSSGLGVPLPPASMPMGENPHKVLAHKPIARARDARLPPLLGTGDSVDLHIDVTHQIVQIAGDISYRAWTFNKTAPGPVIRVRQGQKVNVTFTNHSDMLHSIDFHSAEIPPNEAYKDIDPGEVLKFSFTPRVPGAFIYHCGTPPVVMHLANGMYGVIIVDPIVPLPPADVSYVLLQSEWYTRQDYGGVLAENYPKMLAKQPNLMSFNGVAFQYHDHPLPAKAGRRIRIYFVNAGPSLWSAFHVIGGIFDKVYPSGRFGDALTGVSTYTVAPGEGDIFDIILPAAGQYAFVDHSMANMDMGAVGVFDVQ